MTTTPPLPQLPACDAIVGSTNYNESDREAFFIETMQAYATEYGRLCRESAGQPAMMSSEGDWTVLDCPNCGKCVKYSKKAASSKAAYRDLMAEVYALRKENKLLRADPASPSLEVLALREEYTPCAVTVYPATTFSAGCKLSTVIECIRSRAWPSPCPDADMEAFGNAVNSINQQAHLRQQLAEAQKDAARYRWLRDVAPGLARGPMLAFCTGHEICGLGDPDAAIDAAMARGDGNG